ncbi:uncharacterized protein [Parasteatoda tepidariorum]|uniref:uncharacterized protein n=1 Tax=Parasteatoda tepidariorum TaxID=114398 RepID=UPI0039BC31B9
MVETLEDESGILVQIAFEESFDADTKNAAFNIWIMGKNATFIENFETKQTFRYTDNAECAEMTVTEWIKTKSPPSLLNYEDTNGTVRFSLKQLFSLDDKYLKEKDIPDEFRGISARKWMYEIVGEEPDGQRRVLSIYAYWSDKTWNTTSNEEQVPLGFVVSKMIYKRGSATVKLHEQFINVFGFVPNTIDHKLFEPIQGIVCPNRKQTVKFPDVSNWQAVALHSEVIFPDYQQINYVDVWFDPINKLLRQDMERIKDQEAGYEKNLKYGREMVLGKLGIVYQLRYFKGEVSCNVIGIPDYEYDIQNLIHFKANLKDWTIGNLFGINQTTYTYIGKTSKRDIPCHLFQGVRKDWPEPTAEVESLWEWCFSMNVTTKDDAVIFRNGEYGLVSAQVNIIKSGSKYDFPEKYRLFHHFYDVNLVDPTTMDATSFDIGACFGEDEKRRLQFVIDWAVNDDSIYLIENATSDVNFLKNWKSALYRYSGIDPNSLRVTKVKAVIEGKELVLKFTFLDIHPKLPQEIKDKQITAFNAEKKLRENVKNKAIYMNYRPSQKAKIMRLGVVPLTVNFQLNDSFVRHELPTTTTVTMRSTTRRFPFSLITEPDDNTESPATGSTDSVTGTGSTAATTPDQKRSTPTPTKENLKEPNKNLHKSGTVAGVSIAMVLIGITIGASGVFIKANGLPPCLKCAGV